MAEIVLVLADKIERLAQESTQYYRDAVSLRDKLAAAEKECQELRDALKEAVGIQDRGKVERLAPTINPHIIDATILANMLDQAGVPKPIGDASVTNRVRYLLDFYLDILQAKRTTQDG